MVAALYVDPRGVYASIRDVDAWGLPDRDAREYTGPWPVVAHPPCARWAKLALLWHPETFGDDGGCGAAAVAAARRWGGVVEQPEGSGLWAAQRLPHPGRGLWTSGAECDAGREYAVAVDQGLWGHPAPKPTWILLVSAQPPAPIPFAFRGRSGAPGRVLDLDRSAREATPPAFAAWLVELAEGSGDRAWSLRSPEDPDRCEVCGAELVRVRRGPPRRLCGAVCRQRASRAARQLSRGVVGRARLGGGS